MNLRSLRLTTLATALVATTSLYGLIAVAGTAWGATPAALAQQGPPPGGRAAAMRRFGEMLGKLGLTDAQKTQIKGFMQAARDQNQNVTDPEQRRANFQAALAKVDGVLTPAQRAKFKQLRAQMRHDHPAH
jgi:Spy/CpxP family protein refolding chaperone